MLSEVVFDRNDCFVVGLNLGTATGTAHKPERVLISRDPIKRRLQELFGQPGVGLVRRLVISVENSRGSFRQKCFSGIKHIDAALRYRFMCAVGYK